MGIIWILTHRTNTVSGLFVVERDKPRVISDRSDQLAKMMFYWLEKDCVKHGCGRTKRGLHYLSVTVLTDGAKLQIYTKQVCKMEPKKSHKF